LWEFPQNHQFRCVSIQNNKGGLKPSLLFVAKSDFGYSLNKAVFCSTINLVYTPTVWYTKEVQNIHIWFTKMHKEQNKAGLVDCLGWCRKKFYSPNRFTVRFCEKCTEKKTQNERTSPRIKRVNLSISSGD
jgi:hypothetical protein